MSEVLHSYPWYPDDWRGSRARALLDLRSQGLYRALLDIAYEDGSISTDEDELRKLVGCTAREWKDAWPKVRPWFTERDNRLYNNKVDTKRPEIIKAKTDRKRGAEIMHERRRRQRAQHDAEGGSSTVPSNMPSTCPLPSSSSPSPSTTSSTTSSTSKLERATGSGEEGGPGGDVGARTGPPEPNPKASGPDPVAEVADGVMQWLGHVGVAVQPPSRGWCEQICRIVFETGGTLDDLEAQLQRWAGIGPNGDYMQPRIPPSPPWGWIRKVLAEDFPAFVQVRKAGGVA